MKKNIRLITPIITEGIRNLGDVEPFARADLEFSHSLLDIGPSSIESEYDEALSVPDTIRKTIEAEKEGAHAVVIDCMGDPGLKPAREVVSIPVLAPCETSMHLATMLGHRFSFVTVLDSVVPMIENLAKVYGTYDALASVRVINIPVLEIEKDISRVQCWLAEEAVAAVREDRADAIILGCTGFLGCADVIKAELSKNGYDIPVIDPVPATVLTAAALVDLGLSQSKITYATPPQKPLVGYEMPSLNVA